MSSYVVLLLLFDAVNVNAVMLMQFILRKTCLGRAYGKQSLFFSKGFVKAHMKVVVISTSNKVNNHYRSIGLLSMQALIF